VGKPHVLVIGDSLAFHGPEKPELLTHPDLYPNVIARELDAEVDVVARFGWTARDAWWAMTKDPTVYSILLPRADAVVLAMGGMDHLPTWLPTYLRDGLGYIRPGWLRRRVKLAFHRANPYLVRATGGRLRVLPQAATLAYLTRCVQAIRALRPGIPVIAMVPPPYDAPYYGHVTTTHEAAVTAHKEWGERLDVPLADGDEIVGRVMRDVGINPDGMHWSWPAHAAMGAEFAELIRKSAADRKVFALVRPRHKGLGTK
jgi:hypothetical protein